MAIIDDGIGMSEDGLIEAMRPGSKNPLDDRDENDLGRFGLGLKTASFSQCRKLTVVSSIDSKKSATQWDLDFVAKTEDWSLRILDEDNINSIYKIDLLDSNGTLVLWEDTDRIIDNTVSSLTEDIVYEKINLVQKHLELVFHRYLKGKNKINIFINDEQLQPFDPFHSTHLATQELTPPEYELKVKNHDESLIITAKNKMIYSSEITASIKYYGELIETRKIPNNDIKVRTVEIDNPNYINNIKENIG